MSDARDNKPARRAYGPMVVVLVLLAAVTLGLFSTIFAYQTRWRVQIEALHERLSAVEEKLDIESEPLPSREVAE